MGNEEGLDDDVASRAPRGLPRSNVDEDEVHLEEKVVELGRGRGVSVEEVDNY